MLKHSSPCIYTSLQTAGTELFVGPSAAALQLAAAQLFAWQFTIALGGGRERDSKLRETLLCVGYAFA